MFCELWRGDYHISMLLKEILWKRKVITCFRSLLCARHSAGCFPGSFKIGNAVDSCLCLSYATIPKKQSPGSSHICFLLFPGGLLLTLLSRELCLSLVALLNPVSKLFHCPLPPLPYCLQLLPNTYCLPLCLSTMVP